MAIATVVMSLRWARTGAFDALFGWALPTERSEAAGSPCVPAPSAKPCPVGADREVKLAGSKISQKKMTIQTLDETTEQKQRRRLVRRGVVTNLIPYAGVFLARPSEIAAVILAPKMVLPPTREVFRDI